MSYVTENIDRLLQSFAGDPHLLTPGGHLLDFSAEEEVVSLVVGDLHGDFATLDETFRFFEELKRQEEGHRYRWIFLGDYVDRGPNSGALLDYLLRFRMEKMANNRTDDVYLLRGNHEDWLTGPQGVYTPVAGDPGQALFLDTLAAPEREQYRALFAALPVVAFLPGKVMVVHGGIPKPAGFPPEVDFPGVSDRASLENPELLSQMLWGDPVAVDWRIVAGTRFEFGRKQCEHFMERLDLAVIVRGHEPVAGGFRADYDGRVLTVFSSGAPSAETSYPMVETPALLVMGADRYSVFRRQQGGEALFVEEQCSLPRSLKAERDEAAARIREEELRAAQEAADQLERAAKEEELRKAIREAALRGAATARREEKARQAVRPVVYKMADLMFIIDLEKSAATDTLPGVMARFLYRLAGGDPEAFILKLLNLTTGFLNPALGNHVQLFVSSEQDREKRGGAFSDEQGVGAMLTGLLSGNRKGTAEKTMAAMLEVLRTKLWREQATRYLIVLTDSSSEEKTEVMTQITAEAAGRKVTVWVIGCDLSRKTVSLYEEVTRLPRCACIPLSKEQADWHTVFAKLHKSISATV